MGNTTYWTNTYKPDGPPRISYSWDLEKILKALDKKNNYVAFELLTLAEKKTEYANPLKITEVDVSKADFSFDVTLETGKWKKKIETMKISKFIKAFFQNHLNNNEIQEFAKMYNDMKGKKSDSGTADGEEIKTDKFKYNPKDVKSTFVSLTTKTYPHGCEDELLEFLPPDLEKDEHGNYFKIIGGGKPETMFCCHLDTADRIQKDVTLLSVVEKDDEGKYESEEYIITDGFSILGADDKAGTTVMMYLMAHNIPGLYYFFIGEERGGIGSHAVDRSFMDFDYLQNIRRAVAFDRRDYHSVITRQMGRTCCSDEFGTALCKGFNANGLNLSLDTTGVFTDTASFIEDVPECTNISCGYMHEHTSNEYQNITYLELLCKAAVRIDWDKLPTVRKVGLDQEIIKKYGPLVREIRKSLLYDVKVAGTQGGVFLTCDLEFATVDGAYTTLIRLSTLLKKHKVDQEVTFDDTCLKIQLK